MSSAEEQCPWCGSRISRTKFLEIKKKIRREERQKLAAAEARLEQKFKRDLVGEKRKAGEQAAREAEKRIAKITADRNRSVKKVEQLQKREQAIRKEAEKKAKEKFKKVRDAASAQQEKELFKQREILEKDKDKALLKRQAEFNRERDAYQKKVKGLERRLQRKTTHEMGDGAELDLFETLRDAFPSDQITRIPKGQRGADIRHEVLHGGEVCGTILIDSKNRQVWQNVFVTKLRQDQVDAQADHAIVSTTVFPKGEKELCVRSGVIVVTPARVAHIVELLRSFMVRMHLLGLSMKQRTGKMSRLYQFIASEAFRQHLEEALRLTDDLLELDVEEQKQHQNVWKRRGLVATQLKNVLRKTDTEISAILEGNEPEDTGDGQETDLRFIKGA